MIKEKDVFSFFLSEEGELIRGCTYKRNVSAVFKAGLLWKEEVCGRILTFFPALRTRRNTIQYLTEEEVSTFAKTLVDMENQLSLRDRAIGTLLLYTGLRGCDIAGMLLGSIDWEQERIYIHQSKTDVDMELPLTVTVGNAIFGYLESERPQSEDPHLFLSEVKPCRPLESKSLGNVVNTIFKVAGIRQNLGDRKGTHIFRHHMASHMLECGVPKPVISRTMGHTSPTSLDPYVAADFKHLKECALSVELFPVPEEVLAI